MDRLELFARLASACVALAVAGCGSPSVAAEVAVTSRGLAGVRIAARPTEGPFELVVEDGRIARILPASMDTGLWVAPAFIDAHVHLAYLPKSAQLLNGGIAAAVDLAAPEGTLAVPQGTLRVIGSGPMITAVSGYPTQGWGRDGYGLEVADAEAAARAVDRLHAAGAKLIKIPITGAPVMDDATMKAAIDRAHALSLRVFVHALSNDEAARGARLGADVLAHTPVEALDDATVEAWKDRAVVSTLAAFGGLHAADNLRRLRAAGATILYGTDFGNTSQAGIQSRELEGLRAAGLDGTAILEAGTRIPAQYFGFDDLGAIEEGKAASFLVLDRDPSTNPETLTRPIAVWIDGRER